MASSLRCVALNARSVASRTERSPKRGNVREILSASQPWIGAARASQLSAGVHAAVLLFILDAAA
jgi:hypothetical protein